MHRKERESKLFSICAKEDRRSGMLCACWDCWHPQHLATLVLIDDPWTPCSLRVFSGHSSEADHAHANIKKINGCNAAQL